MGGHGKGIGNGLGLLIGILASVVISLAFTPTGRSVWSYLTSNTAPTCSNPGWLLQVPDNQITAYAYYEYSNHRANLTVDGDRTTAWLQWWPTADFQGNTPQDNRIHWYLPGTYDLRLICIVDGWTQDNPSYTKTEPIRNAAIDLMNKNCHRYKPTFMDNNWGWQPVNVTCKTSDVVLYVRSVWPAAETPYCVDPPSGMGDCRPLTGISEVKFYYSPGVG